MVIFIAMVVWIVMMVRMALVYKRVPYIKTVEHLWHTLETCAIVDGSIHGDGGMDSDDSTDGARL